MKVLFNVQITEPSTADNCPDLVYCVACWMSLVVWDLQRRANNDAENTMGVGFPATVYGLHTGAGAFHSLHTAGVLQR